MADEDSEKATAARAAKRAQTANKATAKAADQQEQTEHSNTAATQPGGHPAVTTLPGAVPPSEQPGAAGSGDSGPGTGVEGPAEITTAGTRTPARMLDTSAAPIEAPDALTQTRPRIGYDETTTNHVAASAAVRTYPGEDHVSLVGEDGKGLSAGSLFDKPEGPETYVTVKERVYEEFKYPGSQQTTKRLLWPEGARVDALTAARFVSAHEAVTA